MFKYFSKERAFTLIELLVVILIIGILIAVAAPSFLGQQEKARVSGVKQNLSVIYKSAKADTVRDGNEAGSFRTSVATLITEIGESEPQLASKMQSGTGRPADATKINVAVSPDGNTLTLVGATAQTTVTAIARIAPTSGQAAYEIAEGPAVSPTVAANADADAAYHAFVANLTAYKASNGGLVPPMDSNYPDTANMAVWQTLAPAGYTVTCAYTDCDASAGPSSGYGPLYTSTPVGQSPSKQIIVRNMNTTGTYYLFFVNSVGGTQVRMGEYFGIPQEYQNDSASNLDDAYNNQQIPTH